MNVTVTDEAVISCDVASAVRSHRSIVTEFAGFDKQSATMLSSPITYCMSTT